MKLVRCCFLTGELVSAAVLAPKSPWLPASLLFGIPDSACYNCPATLASQGLLQIHLLSFLPELWLLGIYCLYRKGPHLLFVL